MTPSPQIISKFYDFLLYLIPQVSKFPRTDRYLVGERLENLCFDIMELLLEAVYSREKTACLQKVNLRLEQARYYVRLCKDLKLMDLQGNQDLSKMINEVGKQLGGWIKQQQKTGS